MSKLQQEHLRVLRGARELIYRYGFCRDFLAQDKDGNKVQFPWEESAVVWSLTGAIGKLRGEKPVESADNPIHFLSKACIQLFKTKLLLDYNDNEKTLPEDIIAIYDRAIDLSTNFNYKEK